MKKIFLITYLLVLIGHAHAQQYQLQSPNKKISCLVSAQEGISYQLLYENKPIIKTSQVSIQLEGKEIAEAFKVKKADRRTVNDVISPLVRQKNTTIQNHFNELRLQSKGIAIVFRLYNDGLAYRWETNLKQKELVVQQELAEFNFENNVKLWFPKEKSMYSHQERKYLESPIESVEQESFASTPLLAVNDAGLHVLITEANLKDYPGMFLEKNTKHGLKGKWAQYPDQTEQTSDRDVKVVSRTNYLAKTQGRRTFPWRVVVLSEKAGGLVESELVFKLAPPLQIKNPEWIKPGKVAWDWWNALNLKGVDFKAGVNTATYKHYIDFAAVNNIDYIILDEGWYHLDDVMKIKKEVDVVGIIEYGKRKNVGVILWVTWKALDDQLDLALAQFQSWGVKGIKVDFMQRDDQWMVNYYWKIAKKSAEHQLLVDFHGAYKPTGLRRAYPNVITREGVMGLEHNKWSANASPDHNLTIPFIRMVAGPIDYTPGAMLNANEKNFNPVFERPMSQGTRCHQLAMYVVYESPLQMLADSPSHYEREKESMAFLSAVPTVWDETKVMEAKVGDYILMRRKRKENWYVAGMTDWNAREMELDFSFLESNKKYAITIWKDGRNADRNASDFAVEEIEINAASVMKIKLAPGGGWVAKIAPLD